MKGRRDTAQFMKARLRGPFLFPGLCAILARMMFLKPILSLVALALLWSPPLQAQPLREDTFLRIGGIEQWVTIRSQDTANPVVLFLHGGPGEPLTPHADSLFAGWDRDFTLVQWDQRGTGKTFGRSGAQGLSMERLSTDGIALAEHLATRLNKKKIILVGHDTGSMLGIQMVRARPDLFHAFVGLSQLTSLRAASAAGYATLLKQAQAAKDAKTIADLTALGPPDWQRGAQWLAYRRLQQPYAPRDTGLTIRTDAAYATDLEQLDHAQGKDYSFVILFGLTMAGSLMQQDLPALGNDFALPIFMIAGERDIAAPPELAKAWFDSIRAPAKRFILVPGAGHEFSRASLAALKNVLLKEMPRD